MNWIILIAIIALTVFCYKKFGKYAAIGIAVFSEICWLLWLGALNVFD